MKTTKFLLFFLLIVGAISCQKEETEDSLLQAEILTDDHKQFLAQSSVNPENSTITTIDVEGKAVKYFKSNDLLLEYSEFENWLDQKDAPSQAKQFTGRYTISPLYRRFTVLAGSNLTRRARIALQDAVKAVNDIGTSVQIGIKYSGTADCVVTFYTPGPFENGQAPLPNSSGRPGSFINISTRLDSDFVKMKQVLIHELGHVIGLMHQDWKTLQSCGGGSNSGFVQWIPGTPTSDREPSVMQACANGRGATKIFSASDKRAINIIY